jgi:hypothetical protein
MSENNRLTRYAIKRLTFMSETCQVAAVGGRGAPLSLSIYDGPSLAHSPHRDRPHCRQPL